MLKRSCGFKLTGVRFGREFPPCELFRGALAVQPFVLQDLTHGWALLKSSVSVWLNVLCVPFHQLQRAMSPAYTLTLYRLSR
jgi:hypothetical protein